MSLGIQKYVIAVMSPVNLVNGFPVLTSLQKWYLRNRWLICMEKNFVDCWLTRLKKLITSGVHLCVHVCGVVADINVFLSFRALLFF